MTIPTHIPTTASPGAMAGAAAGDLALRAERARAHMRWGPPRAQRFSDGQWLYFLILHPPLVMAMKASALIATAHALMTFAVGLSCLRFRTPERVIYAMGYIIASEPLWRVGRAKIFYESGKYAIAGLSILALLGFRLLPRSDKTPLIYFFLLTPSILMLPEFDRGAISFNLSGPFSLAMCTLFLSTQKISSETLRRLFLITLGPILGLVFAATFSTVTTENINFYSSKVAAAGLGNNQASSIFGLGLLLAFFYLFVDRRNRRLRWLMVAIGLWCGGQAALTFSRGGVATALGAIAAASFFLLRDRRARVAYVLRIGSIAILAAFVVIPLLNTITGGAVSQRFSDRHLTGRDKIIEADLLAFEENPLFGVGPGGSKDYHVLTLGARASTHTEYSRLLAEHGLLGLAAVVLLAWMAFKRLRRPSPSAGIALAVGFTTWTLLFMFHAAMRMAAASFIFALGASYLMAVNSNPTGGRRRGAITRARRPPARHRATVSGSPAARR